MPDPHQSQLIREATFIFLRLRDNPDDPNLLKERDLFLARGEAEKLAYKQMLGAWQATKTETKKPGSKTLSVLAALAVLAGGTYAAFEPMRVMFQADITSTLEPSSWSLASGDRITLDASSAVIDDTSEELRHVTLLRGAAFFDVARDQRAFIVQSRAVEVTVLGTSFEVGETGDGVIVTVATGSVQVDVDGETWQLEPGQQLIWSDTRGARFDTVDIANAASWRQDTLASEGITVAELADTLDRRMSGRILIMDARLRKRTIAGSFDLSDPAGSLELIAELTGAELTSVPFFGTLVRR